MTGGIDFYNRGDVHDQNDCTGLCNKCVEEEADDNAVHMATEDSEGLNDDCPESEKTACNILGEDKGTASAMESEEYDDNSNPKDDYNEYNLPEARQECLTQKNNRDAEEIVENHGSKTKLLVTNRNDDSSILKHDHDEDLKDSRNTSFLVPNTPETLNLEINSVTAGNRISGNNEAACLNDCGVLDAAGNGKSKENKDGCDILVTLAFEMIKDHGHDKEDANTDKASVRNREPTSAEGNADVNLTGIILKNTKETSDDLYQRGGQIGNNISLYVVDAADNSCDRPPLDHKVQHESAVALPLAVVAKTFYDADIDHAAENDQTTKHVDTNAASDTVPMISKESLTTGEQEHRKNSPRPQMMEALSDEASKNKTNFRAGTTDLS
ncbi:hypothetical protein ACA910_003573 [Epithemia clementina (nom. ined.)]